MCNPYFNQTKEKKMKIKITIFCPWTTPQLARDFKLDSNSLLITAMQLSAAQTHQMKDGRISFLFDEPEQVIRFAEEAAEANENWATKLVFNESAEKAWAALAAEEE